MEKFRIIEHTADIGVCAYGSSLGELFENAATAFFTLIVKRSPQKNIHKKFNLEAESVEDLLFNWVNELISLFYAEKFFPAEYDITIIEKGKSKILNAIITGDRFDPCQNTVEREIKALTYYNLAIKKDAKGYYSVELIFDV